VHAVAENNSKLWKNCSVDFLTSAIAADEVWQQSDK